MVSRFVVAACAILCLAAEPDTAQAVRIAHPLRLTPFIYVENGKTVGLVADLLRAAAGREGLGLAFVPASPGELLKSVKDGTVDAFAPFPITAQNELTYDFTSPLTVTGGALFVQAPQPEPGGLAELAGKTVVTPKTGPFVTYIQTNFPSVKLVTLATYNDCLDRVISGQAQAAALNIREGANVVAASYAGKITLPKTMFLQLSLGLAVVKGEHAELIRRLDAGIAAIAADGTMQQIENQWEGR